MNYVYQNKYGRLEIKVIEPYRQVSTIRCKDVDGCHTFGIDEAEKIALITDNRGTQICFEWIESAQRPNAKKAVLIHHQSCSVEAVSSIVSIEFNKNTNATEILAR